jgi:type II restriction enzyme
MSLTGNKGEWSEIYALLKVITDRNLYGGDANLKRIESLVYPIIEVIRMESGKAQSFIYDKDEIVVSLNGDTYILSIKEVAQHAQQLFMAIKNSEGRAFEIVETEKFIQSFGSKTIKADSTAKEDLRIIIHDPILGTTPELGFSIKSQLGGASTLLNAGRTTNFIFRIDDFIPSAEFILETNSIDSRSKIQDRLKAIESAGGKFRFEATEKSTFRNNLTLIDSSLPEIIANAVYEFFSSSSSTIADLIQKVAAANPLNFDSSEHHPFYSYKVKRMLTDMALGMMPSKMWDGQLNATGGYLVVKEDGDVLCYHVYNRNDFENYLFENTRLDTSSSTRHEYGMIYEEGGHFFFKLNLQIRFIK